MMRDSLTDFRGGYTRDEWWGKKQAANAEQAAKFRADIGAPAAHGPNNYDGFPPDNGGDDDLPF